MEKMRELSVTDLTEEALMLTSLTPALNREKIRLEILKDRLLRQQVEIAIIGQFKRGKSSVANAILGEPLMPVGIVPVTSVVTKVVSGTASPKVCFNDGKVEEVKQEQLSLYISEQENKNNILDVKEVIVESQSSFLNDNTVFVDTPGVGSFHVNNTETAYEHMKESDAVIFLLSVDSPINQIEIEFLKKAAAYAGKFYFVVNKVDMVSEDDLKVYLDYCSQLIGQLMETNNNVALFPISARSGYGIETLVRTIKEDQNTKLKEIMESSARKKLMDIIDSSLTALNFYRKAMNMPYAELDKRFHAIDEFLQEEKAKLMNATGFYQLHLNQLKLAISQKVKELFDMDYTYYITTVDSSSESFEQMSNKLFQETAEEICRQLEETLNEILLYREENAYLVVKKISQINSIVRGLRDIKNDCIKAENMV